MNKIFVIGLLLISILAFGASAADLTLSTASLSPSDTRPTESFSVSFTVSNASANLSSLSLSQSGLNNFNINFSVNSVPGSTFSLNTGETKTITVSGAVPKNINTKLTPFIGSIIISGSGLTTKALSININSPSQLDLENVKFIVDGSSRGISEGETRNDVSPGSTLEITGDVRNLFTSDEDIKIESINVEITIEGIDDGEDISDSIDVSDIRAGKKDNFKLSFDIPEDIADDDYAVNILVDGTDENGAKHSVEWTGTQININKDSHDIRISKATLSTSTLSCSKTSNLNVKIKNQGTNNEDAVVLKIANDELGISVEDANIPEIDEGTGSDTEYSKTYPIKIGDNVVPGTYSIALNVYYDTDTLSETKNVDMTVAKCAVGEATPSIPLNEKTWAQLTDAEKTIVQSLGYSEKTWDAKLAQAISPTVVVAPPAETEETPEIITSPATETTETSFLQSNSYLIFLVAAIGVAVIVIIILAIVLFALKKRE